MKCNTCQYPLAAENNFCPNCGAPVEKPSSPPAAPVQEADKTSMATDIPIIPPPPSSPREEPAQERPAQQAPVPREAAKPSAERATERPSEQSPEHPPEPSLEQPTPRQDVSTPSYPPSTTPPSPLLEEIEEQAAITPEGSSGRKTPPSQHTMDSIDLAIAQDIEEETVFEEPPLYIPQPRRSKAPIVIALVIAAVVLGAIALFSLGDFTLPSFSSQSPMVLSSGSANLNYGMSPQAAQEELGEPITIGEDGLHQYEDGVTILYREEKAVQITLTRQASHRWRTSGTVSIGDSRSDIFKAYGTDNLVSVMETIQHLDDPAHISQLQEYLVPYQMQEGGYVQINTVNQQYYQDNPLEYYWVAFHIAEDDTIDTIILGDTLGVFETQ